MAGLDRYSPASQHRVVSSTLEVAAAVRALVRPEGRPRPHALGFDLEFSASGAIALIQLSSESLTVLFHVAQFRGTFCFLVAVSLANLFIGDAKKRHLPRALRHVLQSCLIKKCSVSCISKSFSSLLLFFFT